MFGIEFYVILATVAAAIVAVIALPARRGAARTFFVEGALLSPSEEGPATEEAVRFSVNDHGSLLIYRSGLDGVRSDGAVNLAVKVAGLDVVIEERITPGRRGEAVGAAVFEIDFLGPERFHFQYRNTHTNQSASLTLNLRPGNALARPLQI